MESAFSNTMENLKLPYPKRMDFAVPGNKLCGEPPPELSEELRRQYDADTQG